jgi:hypothetical protein
LPCCGYGFGDGITFESRLLTMMNLIKSGLDVLPKTAEGVINLNGIKRRKSLYYQLVERGSLK